MKYLSLLFMFCFMTFCSFLRADWITTSQDGLTVRLTDSLDTLNEEKKVYLRSFTESYSNNPTILNNLRNQGKDLSTFLLSAFEDEEKDFRSKKANTIFLSAKTLDGKTIGYTSFDKGTDAIYIRQLSVDPDYWKKGVGTVLIFAIFNVWTHPTKLQLATRCANTRAISFYQKLGFTFSDHLHEGLDPKVYCGLDRLVSNEEVHEILGHYRKVSEK